jgi:hypothetical protein
VTSKTLYRGDAEKIKEFDVRKTDKHCAVGQGVYLTDSLTVAQSYRDKGASSRNGPDLLFSGPAKNRGEAYELALPEYVRWRIRADNLVPSSHPLYWKSYDGNNLNADQRKLLEKFKDKFRAEYRQLIEEKTIVAQYHGSITTKYHLTVTMEADAFTVGYITEFKFSEFDLRTTMFKCEGHYNGFWDRGFWEIAWDEHGGSIGAPYTDRDSYIRANLGLKPNCKFDTLRRILEPYGYRGFEYQGGIRTNSIIRHRAFCVWHDDWLNEHRVRRFR